MTDETTFIIVLILPFYEHPGILKTNHFTTQNTDWCMTIELGFSFTLLGIV